MSIVKILAILVNLVYNSKGSIASGRGGIGRRARFRF